MKTLPVGTELICENGHKICEIVIEPNISAPASSSMFGNFVTDEKGPQAGDINANFTCCRCGAQWMRKRGDVSGRFIALQIHTSKGWWP